MGLCLILHGKVFPAFPDLFSDTLFHLSAEKLKLISRALSIEKEMSNTLTGK